MNGWKPNVEKLYAFREQRNGDTAKPMNSNRDRELARVLQSESQPVPFEEFSMVRSALLAASGLLALAMATSAFAGTYRLDFYNGVFMGEQPLWDPDGDGIVDYSGTFTAPGSSLALDAGLFAISAIDVTIDGMRFDTVQSGGFPSAPWLSAPSSDGIPIPTLLGFAFEDLPLPNTSVPALQFGSLPILRTGGAVELWGLWAPTTCNVSGFCGGGPYRGAYTITAIRDPNPVSEPSSLPLAALGLFALAGWSRRRLR